MKTKITALLLTVTLLASVLLLPAAAADIRDFCDIRNHWCYAQAQYCVENGLISGISDTEFGPNVTLTRAMFVTVLARLAGTFGYTEKDGVLVRTAFAGKATSAFPDVKAGDWFAAAVAWASDKGIVSGTDAGKFEPNASITREQMAVILFNFFAKEMNIDLSTETAAAFPDAGGISKWAKAAADAAAAAQLIVGDDKGNFNPQQKATRAMAAVVLYRVAALCDEYRQETSYILGGETENVYFESFAGNAVPDLFVVAQKTGTLTVGRQTYSTIMNVNQVAVNDGSLALTLAKDGNQLRMGSVTSETIKDASYGYYTFRCILPKQAYGIACSASVRIGDLLITPFYASAWDETVTVMVTDTVTGDELFSATAVDMAPTRDGLEHSFSVHIEGNECTFYCDGIAMTSYEGAIPAGEVSLSCDAVFAEDAGIPFPALLPVTFRLCSIEIDA